MSDNGKKKDAPTTAEASVNWEGLKRFTGWQGSIQEHTQVELDRATVAAPGRPRTGTNE